MEDKRVSYELINGDREAKLIRHAGLATRVHTIPESEAFRLNYILWALDRLGESADYEGNAKVIRDHAQWLMAQLFALHS